MCDDSHHVLCVQQIIVTHPNMYVRRISQKRECSDELLSNPYAICKWLVIKAGYREIRLFHFIATPPPGVNAHLTLTSAAAALLYAPTHALVHFCIFHDSRLKRRRAVFTISDHFIQPTVTRKQNVEC